MCTHYSRNTLYPARFTHFSQITEDPIAAINTLASFE